MSTATSDPVNWLLQNLRDEDYTGFARELGDAVTAVCSSAHKPNELGRHVQRLAEVIRSWHLSVALGSDPEWLRQVSEFEATEDTDHEIGDLRRVRKLLDQ